MSFEGIKTIFGMSGGGKYWFKERDIVGEVFGGGEEVSWWGDDY